MRPLLYALTGAAIAVGALAVLAGGLYLGGYLDATLAPEPERPRLDLAALESRAPEQRRALLAPLHAEDEAALQATESELRAVFAGMLNSKIQRRKLCVSSIFSRETPMEEVDPAAGFATELTSECSVVIGWLEQMGSLLGGEPTEEQMRRILSLWDKYFLSGEDLTRELGGAIEATIQAMRARRDPLAVELGGENWIDLQQALSADPLLLGRIRPPVTDPTTGELEPGPTAEPAALKALEIVDAALVDGARALNAETRGAASAVAEAGGADALDPAGARAWIGAIAATTLDSVPEQRSEAASAIEAEMREAIAVASDTALRSLEARLAAALAAQHAAETALLDGAGASLQSQAPPQ